VENTIRPGIPGSSARHAPPGAPTPKDRERDTIARMTEEDPNPESAPEAGRERLQASLPLRLAALLALIALLASAAVASWWIVTDRVDFFAAGAPRSPASANEPPGQP